MVAILNPGKHRKIRNGMISHCVIKCPNCVVEKIHLFFLAGETESVFEITNWDTRTAFITASEMILGSTLPGGFEKGAEMV